MTDATDAERTAALVAAATMLVGLGFLAVAAYLLYVGSLLLAVVAGVVGVGVFAGGSLFGYRAV